MLRVENLRVHYGEVAALDGIDLTVEDGEVMCVLGPSGCGKTTLLRAIAGLEIPDTGTITRDGVDLTPVEPHRRGLGLMFQEQTLFPHRDVLGNVAFGLRMRGDSRYAAQARAREVLALVGLAGFEHRGVHELSGGESQRVALARAIAPAPALLMLDEPLGALDRALRERLADELRELFDRLALSVLCVTHDHDEAFALGSNVAVMRAGRIEQAGTATEVWRRPATEFVARFLGFNVVDLGGVHTALRPDSLRLDDRGPLAGRVVDRIIKRDHVRIRVALDRHDETIEVVVRDVEPPAPGSDVRLAPQPDGIVELGSAPPACTGSAHLRQDSPTLDP